MQRATIPMSYLLKRIMNWSERAADANWSVSKLASQLGVSVRTLERHFANEMKKSPGSWMNSERQRRAIELLRDGSTVKETAMALGYMSQHAFGRAFKKYHQESPSRYQEIGKLEEVQSEN